MLAKTLGKLIDEHRISAKEVGKICGVAPSTVYRWVRGESQPDFDSIRLLVRYLKNDDVIEAILSSFTAGTGWHFYHIDTDLDVNQDGKIDAGDAIDASIEAVEAAGKSIGKLRDSSRDGAITHDEAVTLVALLNDVIRQCSITQQILVHMSQVKQVKT